MGQRQDHEALHVLRISHEKLSGFRCWVRSQGLLAAEALPRILLCQGEGWSLGPALRLLGPTWLRAVPVQLPVLCAVPAAHRSPLFGGGDDAG